MSRLFDTHHIRKCKELEGMWEFAPVAGIGERPASYTDKSACSRLLGDAPTLRKL